MKNEFEIRSIQTELTNDSESRSVHGLAIPIESRSELLNDGVEKFYEVITRDAVSSEFISSQDIKLYINHDASQGTFGRSKFGTGTLKLYTTDRGLEFDVELPNSAFGDALLEGIRRRDYDAISFAFVCGDEQWDRDDNGILIRSISSFALLDEISILSIQPAYPATNVNTRALEEFREKEAEQEEAAKKDILDRLEAKLNEINIKATI